MVNIHLLPDRKEGLAVGTVLAVMSPGNKRRFFRIRKRDTIFLRDLHSSLASGSTENFAEITNLDPPSSQLYQIHTMKLDGNVEVRLKQPAATNRWGTQRSPTGGFILDKYNGELLNIWIAEDFPPNVELVNNTDVACIAALWWVGWRYEVEQVTEAPNAVEVSISPPTE